MIFVLLPLPWMVAKRGGLSEEKKSPIPSLVMELLPREREERECELVNEERKTATLKREKCYM